MDQLATFISNNIILAGIWAALVVMLVYSFVSAWVSPVKLVNVHEMTQLINKQDAIILDTRAPAEFKAGHILNARQLKPEEIRSNDFHRLEKHKSQPIIVVCALGNSARAVAAALHKQGFTQACVLQGGISAWQNANLPLTK